MTLDEIKGLIEFIRQNELTEFELERENFKLRVKSGTAVTHVIAAPTTTLPLVTATVSSPTPPPAPAPPVVPSEESDDAAVEEGTEFAIVKSPIVGTFYRSPEPAAASFVEVGTAVKKGQVLCIIEAMKLMNEIDSEYDGEVTSIYVENGQPVQYGERLFAIRLKAGPA
ncbi:MAG: acetyl-CoA carboxylase biotin carboxyl carrier protein [Acidobacteria bacterium]|nr:acetyl-CoA carboxylase biotin carboxyl carrier protein [Acidobacteriota bacterium]